MRLCRSGRCRREGADADVAMFYGDSLAANKLVIYQYATNVFGETRAGDSEMPIGEMPIGDIPCYGCALTRTVESIVLQMSFHTLVCQAPAKPVLLRCDQKALRDRECHVRCEKIVGQCAKP